MSRYKLKESTTGQRKDSEGIRNLVIEEAVEPINQLNPEACAEWAADGCIFSEPLCTMARTSDCCIL